MAQLTQAEFNQAVAARRAELFGVDDRIAVAHGGSPVQQQDVSVGGRAVGGERHHGMADRFERLPSRGKILMVQVLGVGGNLF